MFQNDNVCQAYKSQAIVLRKLIDMLFEWIKTKETKLKGEIIIYKKKIHCLTSFLMSFSESDIIASVLSTKTSSILSLINWVKRKQKKISQNWIMNNLKNINDKLKG